MTSVYLHLRPRNLRRKAFKNGFFGSWHFMSLEEYSTKKAFFPLLCLKLLYYLSLATVLFARIEDIDRMTQALTNGGSLTRKSRSKHLHSASRAI